LTKVPLRRSREEGRGKIRFKGEKYSTRDNGSNVWGKLKSRFWGL